LGAGTSLHQATGAEKQDEDMIAIDPKAERLYVLARERKLPPEQRRRFFIRSLTAREEHMAIDVGQGVDGEGNSRTNVGSMLFFILGCGLARWENCRDAAGHEIKLDLDPRSGKVSDESLATITLQDRMEVARAIESGATVTEAELELSGQPSNQPSGT
jgi:hypothetical protein